MKVSVILPACNEEANIRKMVTMMLALYPKVIYKIIVVDDGSTDNTAGIVKTISKGDKRVELIPNTGLHGVGSALRTGLKHVPKNTTHILTMDADFIRNLTDLEDFFSQIHDYDGLIGSRYKESDSLIHYPYLKKFFNRSFHLLVRILFSIKHADLTNNFKLYKKEVFDSFSISENGFAANAETGLYPVIAGFNIGEIPVIWYARGTNMGISKFKLLLVAPGYIRVLLKASKLSR